MNSSEVTLSAIHRDRVVGHAALDHSEHLAIEVIAKLREPLGNVSDPIRDVVGFFSLIPPKIGVSVVRIVPSLQITTKAPGGAGV